MERPGQRRREAASVFQAADALYRQGRYQDAIDRLDCLGEEFSSDKEVIYARALCLDRLGRMTEAVELCDLLLAKFADARAIELKATISAKNPGKGCGRIRSGRINSLHGILSLPETNLKYLVAFSILALCLFVPSLPVAIHGWTHVNSTQNAPKTAASPVVTSNKTAPAAASTTRDAIDDPYKNQVSQAATLCKKGYWSQSLSIASGVLQECPGHPGALNVQQEVQRARSNFLNNHSNVRGNTHVVCLNNPAQSYEFYAPPGCASEHSQILYAFSPGANGKEMLQWMEAAAARLGWSVAASNNSQNGPWQPIFEAQDAVFRDAMERLDLHPTLRFAGGSSGGARAALAMAFRHPGEIIGVLAMGAGWPVNTDLKPLSNNFSVYILIGDDDSNIKYDIPRTEKKLRAAGVNCVTQIFHGGHVKPPDDFVTTACDWLQSCALASM